MLLAVNYHYIREEFNFQYPSIFGTTPKKFKNQLKVLGNFGTYISESDILDYLRLGKKLPSKSIVITFDDGLAEQYELALPILVELGVPAIFFANTRVLEEDHVLGVHKIHLVRSVLSPSEMNARVESFLRENDQIHNFGDYAYKATEHYKYDTEEVSKLKYLLNFVLAADEKEVQIDKMFNEFFSSEEEVSKSLYMDKEQIIDLAKKGLLGSHSHEHYPIGTLGREQQVYQIQKSQEVFKRITGKSMKSFSYPYGSYEACKGLDKILIEEGHKFAFTMERGVNKSTSKPLFFSRFDNNDMPGGKAWKGGRDSCPFNVLDLASWVF